MRLKAHLTPVRWVGKDAYTLAEALIAVFLLGTLTLSLFGAFSTGLGVVQSARENMRATQILMQKMEAVRLLTWNQSTNTTLATTNFTERYDPLSTNSGTIYRGTYVAEPAPSALPAAYRSSMRQVTMTLYWTNNPGSARARVQSRQMQSLVARYGIQNYVY